MPLVRARGSLPRIADQHRNSTCRTPSAGACEVPDGRRARVRPDLPPLLESGAAQLSQRGGHRERRQARRAPASLTVDPEVLAAREKGEWLALTDARAQSVGSRAPVSRCSGTSLAGDAGAAKERETRRRERHEEVGHTREPGCTTLTRPPPSVTKRPRLPKAPTKRHTRGALYAMIETAPPLALIFSSARRET